MNFLCSVVRLVPSIKLTSTRSYSSSNAKLSSDSEKLELQDSPDQLEQKSSMLSEWISNSKHLIVFTGAGISTSAGIPDFRSGPNTIVPTGPGQWEQKERKSSPPSLNTTIPTFTHLALSQLMKKGILKFVISQNVDGLHLKSGIERNKLAELHGNANIEKCSKCNKQYLRDYKVRKTGSLDHLTGNFCDDFDCNGNLVDTIVLFGDSLDKSVLEKCFEQAEKADLCIVLGSSIRVNPAALFPKVVASHGKLAIINLQPTPLDSFALRVNSLCDPFMQILMSKLGIEVPKFKIFRKIEIRSFGNKIQVRGLDSLGNNFSIFKKVRFGDIEVDKEPFDAELNKAVEIELFFHSHFGEPSYIINPTNYTKDKTETFNIVFCPGEDSWTLIR